MNEDDILQSTKSVLQGLDALKSEHGKILENIVYSSEDLSSNKTEEIFGLVEKSMDMIDLGINEGQIMMQLANYLQNFEAEKHKLHTQVKRLYQENAWLRDELGSTQRRFHECKQINTSYITDFEHLKFLKDIKQVNDDDINSTDQTLTDIDLEDSNHERDLIRELFPIDDDDNEQDYAKEFEPYMNSFISPSQTTNGYEIPERLKTIHNLVLQYVSQGRYEVAVPLCRQALEDLEKTSGHQHPDVATVLNILALVYRDQSKFKEATVLLNDALSIREKILGPDHPAVAATLNNLAVLYGQRNKFQEAESLCKRALEIRENYLGLCHPDVAKQLNNLALLCQNQGKYAEVELYYKRAIDIYAQSSDINDPNVIKTKNNLASIYLKQEKYKEAEKLYQDILTHVNDKDSQSSKQNSSSRTTTENYDLQGNWYKTNRVNIPTVTTILKNLSLLYRRQNRYDAADTIENYVLHALNDSQAITQVLHIIKQNE